MTASLLPPALEFLASEGCTTLESPQQLVQVMSTRRFIKDLYDQTSSTLSSFDYEDWSKSTKEGSRLALGPALDPLADEGKCQKPKCRLSHAENIARSIALYADRIVIPDSITSAIIRAEGDPKRLGGMLHLPLRVLNKLMPLINAGIVCFGAPVHALCLGCTRENDRLTAKAIDDLTDLFLESQFEISVAYKGNKVARLSLSSPLLDAAEHRLCAQISLPSRQAHTLLDRVKGGRAGLLPKSVMNGLRKQIRRHISHDLANVLFSNLTATRSSSTFGAGSQLEALFLSSMDGRSQDPSEVEAWELMRLVKLPTLRELSVEESVQLRSEAGPALHRLRALLADCLNARAPEQSNVADIVRELQVEAAEVESELRTQSSRGNRRVDALIATGSLMLVLYGVLARDSPTALSVLAATLSLLAARHQVNRQEQVETDRIKSRPGYVLLRAKELVQHR